MSTKPRNRVKTFQRRFAPPIQVGTKGSTIRPEPKRQQDWPMVGDILDARMWTDKPYRSAQIRLGTFPITGVRVVDIHESEIRVGANESRVQNLERLILADTPEGEAFATREGFENWSEMIEWFRATHGLPFRGVLIEWLFDIKPVIDSWRAAKRQLIAFKAAIFPRGTPVLVNADRYHGPGVVGFGDTDRAPDHVPVLLGNGNTWWYPIETVTVAPKAVNDEALA